MNPFCGKLVDVRCAKVVAALARKVHPTHVVVQDHYDDQTLLSIWRVPLRLLLSSFVVRSNTLEVLSDGFAMTQRKWFAVKNGFCFTAEFLIGLGEFTDGVLFTFGCLDYLGFTWAVALNARQLFFLSCRIQLRGFAIVRATSGAFTP